MSLIFNMLSRYVIAFIPSGKYLLISWLQTPSTIISDPKKMKSVTISIIYPYQLNCVPQFLLNSIFIIIHFYVYPKILFLRQKIVYCMGFSVYSNDKELSSQCRRHKRPRFNPRSGRSPGENNGNVLQ